MAKIIEMGKRNLRQSRADLSKVMRWLTEHEREMVERVRELVVRESPTQDKLACDELSSYLAVEFERLDGRVKVHRQDIAGDHLQVDFTGDEQRPPLLLLGHLDTVYDVGTIESMPWREEEGQLYGPGVFDMKSGIAQIMFALAALREIRGSLPRPMKVLLVSDEEGGSASSRAITEAIAQQCAAVLVCEPSGPGGALKTARKGVGSFTVKVTGQASHSGLDFEKGQSAILELAHQILAISQLTDLKRGTTLNVGVVRGGTRTNVVAAEAVAEVDVRIAHKGDAAIMERRIRQLRPVNAKCKLEIEGGINRPPMEKEMAATLFHKARKLGRAMGMQLTQASTGGGSDGNFTAALGVPTLDGLGAVGEGAHARHENILISELPRRAALLASLLATL